jgi:hypothetical protein
MGARLEVPDDLLAIGRRVVTDANGDYYAINLDPGVYVVAIGTAWFLGLTRHRRSSRPSLMEAKPFQPGPSNAQLVRSLCA